MKLIHLKDKDFESNEKLKILTNRAESDTEEFEKTVKHILNDIKNNGDSAVIKYTKMFDKIELTPKDFIIPTEKLEEAYNSIEDEVREAVKLAYERVKSFHEYQIEKSFFIEEEGVLLGQKVIPLEKVGLYVPGGKAAYPSSVIMNAVPAKVAKVKKIFMTSPNPNKYTLAAAYICGIDTVYRLGGAQAIGAFAFGTETVKKVDKIVGPGNIFVALAKKNVYGYVDIDSIAGPSEILVIADETANPKWIATDLLSQAEHDELAASILITTSEKLAKQVKDILYNELLKDFEREKIARKSLDTYGHIFVVDNLDMACELSNFIAPEHLEIITENPFELLEKIKHAGAIFLGKYSTEPLGDYVLGPNHVLPTGRAARFSSPLGVYDFIKRSSIIYVKEEGFKKVKEPTKKLATAEGLYAHRLSVEVRDSEQ